MNYYYVQREGVYYQGIFGIFESKREAINHANDCAVNDWDSYHDWVVMESKCKTNITADGGKTSFNCNSNDEEVYTIDKDGITLKLASPD